MSSAARRVLVLVPHPDDEVVGCAVTIRRARALGVKVFALYLTTGVPARATAWFWRRPAHDARVQQRRLEARAVAAQLELEPLTFSGWPSRELKAHLTDAHALVTHHLRATAADQLWVPAYEGGHQDHDVTNFLASLFRPRLPVIEFAEYNAAGGVRTNQFPADNGTEEVLRLTPAEARWKGALAASYRSERANLTHVRFVREALRPLPHHDYRRPPHAGRLFYERFQWVPFRHPRIDFTPASEVTAALTRFASKLAQGSDPSHPRYHSVACRSGNGIDAGHNGSRG